MIISEERLAQIIFSARKGLGYTQQQVSKNTGITQGALSKIEANTCSVSAKHWFLLSEFLDIPHLVVSTGFIDRGIKPKTQFKNSYRLTKRYFENAYSSVKDLIPFLSFIEETEGKEALLSFYKKVGVHPTYFVNLNNPINIEFLLDLIVHFYKSLNLPMNLIERIATKAKVAAFHGVHHDVYCKKNNSLSLIKAYLDYGSYYDQNYKYTITSKTPDQITFEMSPCEYIQNLDQKKQQSISQIMFPYRKKYLENLSNIGDMLGANVEYDNLAEHKAMFSATLLEP